MTSSEPVLAVSGLSKRFGGQWALRDVDLAVGPGEIHALVGENGSGKSTFIKCLAGYHDPEPGASIALAGRQFALPLTPRRAREGGMAFVHQELGLIASMSVLENLALGRGYTTGLAWRVRWKAERRRADELLRAYDHTARPDSILEDLSPADQTLIAIIRGLQDASAHAGLLVLDEPTAALPERESARLLAAVRAIAERGTAVIYVSHRLREVFELADRVTVLRDGRRVLSVV